MVFKNGQPYQVPHDEGRSTYNAGSWSEEFEYRDYLGDLRVGFKESGPAVAGVYPSPIVVQNEDRDPTGVLMASLGVGNALTKDYFGFINRETIAETGWIDLNNRYYIPELMRFGQVDPVIEGQEHLSLYQYGWNNPVLRSDPNGDCPTCLIGGIIGAAVEYGTQVATNAYKSGGLTRDSFTKDINLSAIGFAAVEGAVTQGASAGRKLLVKAAVTVANNVAEVSVDSYGKLTGKVEKNAANVVKNSAIDAISDLTTGGIVGSSAKGAASNVVKSVAGSEGNKLARGVKTALKESGVDITRNVNNTVKETSGNLVKQVPEKIGATAKIKKSSNKFNQR